MISIVKWSGSNSIFNVRRCELFAEAGSNSALELYYQHKARSDNPPERVSMILADWAEQHNVVLELLSESWPVQDRFPSKG